MYDPSIVRVYEPECEGLWQLLLAIVELRPCLYFSCMSVGLNGSNDVMWGRFGSIVTTGAALRSCSNAEGGNKILSPDRGFRIGCASAYWAEKLSSVGSVSAAMLDAKAEKSSDSER